jgi:hypothetical protein
MIYQGATIAHLSLNLISSILSASNCFVSFVVPWLSLATTMNLLQIMPIICDMDWVILFLIRSIGDSGFEMVSKAYLASVEMVVLEKSVHADLSALANQVFDLKVGSVQAYSFRAPFGTRKTYVFAITCREGIITKIRTTPWA